jgi:hypothetical protein
MVVLNAPRSFIADDGLVHLFTYLFVYAMLGSRFLSPPLPPYLIFPRI